MFLCFLTYCSPVRFQGQHVSFKRGSLDHLRGSLSANLLMRRSAATLPFASSKCSSLSSALPYQVLGIQRFYSFCVRRMPPSK